ncbi:MAG TPA: hypothetical protein VHT34_00040 [Clostridia bacterium]|nr:hypothetical protein [Clostridia bacterium]
MFEKRLSIFTGHFGSGKTEVAVNYALNMSKENKVAIVDLDIVNPFFRTADVKEHLEQRGIKVVTPVYANTNVDVPALPAEIYMLFERKDYKVVMDVGGDDLGARAVSRYREEIARDDFDMYLVINTRRPFTDTVEKMEEMIQSIEESSRLKITKLVNNTNLLAETSCENITEGYRLIEKVSSNLGIPISFSSGLSEPVTQFGKHNLSDVLILEKLIKLPWD